jgi:hypothetical protein
VVNLAAQYPSAEGMENFTMTSTDNEPLLQREKVHPLPRWTYPVIAMGVAAAGACLYFTVKAINGC